MLHTEKQVRDHFWLDHPEFKEIYGLGQNNYPTDVRVAFIEYVDYLERSNDINNYLANKVTLG
jgi:hypothetical protein